MNKKITKTQPAKLDKSITGSPRQRILIEPRANESSKPSEVMDVYWLETARRTGTYPPPSTNSGKWLVFVSIDQVDQVWEKIKCATEDGKLGHRAKVATMKPRPTATGPNEKVICVYTYDWTDEEDVYRVRRVLRELGITRKIAYKADDDTRAGKYKANGHHRISKYYE